MAKYNVPKTEFQPHPEGTFLGRITEVRFEAQKQTAFGPKDKFCIVIESKESFQESGDPHALFCWANNASGEKATLTKMRQKLLRRQLTPDEVTNFDDAEFMGKMVRYTVEHSYGNDGQTWANLATWAPADQGQQAAQVREEVQSQQGNQGQPPQDGPPASVYDDDQGLPF